MRFAENRLSRTHGGFTYGVDEKSCDRPRLVEATVMNPPPTPRTPGAPLLKATPNPAAEPSREALLAQLAECQRELEMARERQTATANVLKVISRSVSDARPVFEAILDSCQRLFGLEAVAIYLVEGEVARGVAQRGWYGGDWGKDTTPLAGSSTGQAIAERRAIHFVDLADKPDLPEKYVSAIREAGGLTVLYAPMLAEEHGVGSIVLSRKPAKPFTDREIAFIQSFADQAAIAIQNTRLFDETRGALERQKASADVLSAIGRSVADAAPVFAEILNAGQRLFGAEEMGIYTVGADQMVRVADWRGVRHEEVLNDVTPLAESVTGRIIRERRPHHIPDLEAEPNLTPTVRERVERLGSASLLYAPMLWEERGLGSILVVRAPVRPFSEREIELLQTFADQAAIAIENARLFNETKEALEQQTATADVLKVISRSAFDPQVVLEALVNSAISLSGSTNGMIWDCQNGVMHARAFAQGEDRADFISYMHAHPQQAGRGSTAARVALTGEVQNIADVREDPDYSEDLRRTVQTRATLGVPMNRGDELVGAIVMSKPDPGAYPQRIVELVKTFADQAVIAIENARLFEEVEARTRDLSEALQQQTATADVLKVISRSAFDLQAVLDTLTNSAVELSGASSGVIALRDGDAYHYRAFSSTMTAEFQKFLREHPPVPGPGSGAGRAILSGRVEMIADVLDDPSYVLPAQSLNRTRSILAVPLLRDDRVEGAFVVTGAKPGLYPQRQIELVRTFADQAVIAIGNVRLFEEVQSRTRDLTEALQMQTATSEVLKVISRSAFDLQTVFNTLIASAVSLCGALDGTIFLRDGDVLRYRATSAVSAALAEFFNAHPATAGRGSLVGRLMLSGQVECVPDVLEDKEYLVPAFGLNHYRTRALLGVPLLRDGKVEGALVLARGEPGQFTPRQVELVQTFGDQAIIAIENARLFGEVQARTRDLSEALQQQTATADVLKVISRSAFDLHTVTSAILQTAAQLCRAPLGTLHLRDGDVCRLTTQFGLPEAFERVARENPMPVRYPLHSRREARAGEYAQFADAWSDPDYIYKAVAKTGGYRAIIVIPMMRENELVGIFSLARPEPEAFLQSEIKLVQTFADQAAIAIENVRLFDEVNSKTDDLTEALRMQTATSDVLKVISRSAFDLQAVFNTLVTSAVDLSGAMTGTICVRDGDIYRYRDTVGAEHTSALARYLREHPAVPGRSTIAGRVLLSGKVERIPDCLADPEYVVPMGTLASNVRSLLGVPLLRKDGIEGAIILTRAEPGEFTERQIEIVQTFADQAVIALENVRLFDEVQARTRELSESLKQQTATADVLKVISRSAFDLQVVLETLIRSAGELCEADRGVIWLREGDLYHARAMAGHSEEAVRVFKANPRRVTDKSLVPRVVRSGQVEHIVDVLLEPDFEPPGGGAISMDARTLLGVPLLHGGEVEGVFTLTREPARAFNSRQIEIVQTFADQAVIAIQNVRLFEQVQSRTRELEQSLADLRRTQDRLVQSEKLASLGQLTAGIAHEIKNPLNFVNNFAALSRELLDEMRETLDALPASARAEADELMGMIDSNLDKVVHHGKRADSIVKNMLLHSREGSGERTRVNVNAMVEEALSLGYHGARAEKPGFNVTIEKSLDPEAGEADLYLQEITRVLLNLIGNGFYAAAKRRESEGSDYQPTLTAATRSLGASVEIRIRDNGVGIPAEVREKMFDPFFTTKPAGEGTGLGLSLSHDIVVKQHGGAIEVQTEPGRFTEFIVTLPRESAKH